MYRTETIMTGVPGSPYYNRLHFDEGAGTVPQDLIDATAAFWDDALVQTRDDLTAQVQSEVFQVDEATGVITAALGASSVSVSGSSSQPLKPPTTQALIRLRTGVYVDGRQITGRIFVPSLVFAAGADTPASTYVTALNAAMTALLAAATAAGNPLVVWSPTKGVTAEVTSWSVWDQFAVQRSRRD